MVKDIILIISLLLLFNINIECQLTVQDVTVKPKSLLYSPCIYNEFTILLYDPSSTQYSLNIQNLSPELDGFVFLSKSLVTNSSAALFTITFQSTPVGIYNASFLASSTQQDIGFDIPFECKELTYQEFQYKNLSTRTMELDIFGKISTFVKFENTEASIEYALNPSCAGGCLFHVVDKLGRVEVNNLFSYKVDELRVDFILNGDISNSIKYFPKLYFDSNLYDEISNFKIYLGSDPDNIALISKVISPVFTFESTLTSYYPYYIQLAMDSPSGFSNNFRYRPISSSNNGTTIKYIGLIDIITESNSYTGLSQRYEDPYTFYTNGINCTSLPFDLVPNTPNPIITSGTNYFTIKLPFIGTNYYYTPFKVTYFNKDYYIPSSFMINGGNGENFDFEASFMKEPSALSPALFSFKSFDGTSYSGGFSFTASVASSDGYLPVFESIETIKLSQHYYLLRIKASHSLPIYKYQINEINHYANHLSDNPNGNLLTPTYEFVVNGFDPTIRVVVNEFSIFELTPGKYYDIKNLLYFNPPIYNNDDFDYLDISYAKILYKEIDVTNKTAGNILYFNFTQPIDIETPISFVLFNPKSIFQKDIITKQYPTKDMFPAVYNHSINMFQVEFFVKANSHQGKMPYALFLSSDKYIPSNILPDNAQFTIISNNEDIYGPIFKSISKFKEFNQFGWSLEIIDDYNGIDSVYITVRGALDASVYNFQAIMDSSNDLIPISISLDTYCRSQDYYISNVTLIDKQGYNSTFSFANYINSIEDSLSNPFINYIGNLDILRHQITCEELDDTTPPELLDFNVTFTSPLDVGSQNNKILFEVLAADADSRIKNNQPPSIFLSTSSINIHECAPYTYKNIDAFTIKYQYSCVLPIGFGYPSGILFSIGQIINNLGRYKAYSTANLQSLGFKSSIESNEITISTSGYPSVSGSSRFKEDGGDLWVFGRCFSSITQVGLRYTNGVQLGLQIVQNYNSAIKINLPPSNFSFTLTFNTISDVFSDPYLFKPDPKVENISGSDSTSTSYGSSTASSSTSEELPSNPNQQCQGNPKCGGPSNGYCSTTGCVCYSPWVGLDCMSKVIIVPQPNTNDTEPSTGIDIGGNDNSSSDEISNIVYKSFISLVSLREVDITGEPLYDYKFEKWTYNKLSNTTHQYKTNITTSTITATLQWFDKSTNITFANQQLIMNPSTIKYTIEIENYPFKSQLNSLELIMSASLESTKTDNICSSQQFGNTSNSDNSNYMKIQVDNHSLYGRFIKRGIFDSNNEIRSISNRLIKSNKTNTEYSSNTLIAIQMSYFTSRASIDPDFSIIINPSSASSKSSNSICSKSGLSASKIAGIVIGSVAFAAVVIISVCYYFIKKRNQQKFISNMQHKLNEMK